MQPLLATSVLATAFLTATFPATAGAAITLAKAPDLDFIWGVVVSGDDVFFGGGHRAPKAYDPTGDTHPGSDAVGSLRVASISSGAAPKTLWAGQGYVLGAALAGPNLYFVTWDGITSGRTGTLRVMPADGSGPPRALYTWTSQGSCAAMVSDGTSALLGYSSGTGGAIVKATNLATTTIVPETFPCPGQLVARGPLVAWVVAPGSVFVSTAKAPAPQLLWSGPAGVKGLAASPDGSITYVATDADIWRIQVSTHRARHLLRVPGTISSLAADGSGIYWTQTDGSILTATTDGADEQLLASAEPGPTAIVRTATDLLWVNRGNHTIERLPVAR